MLASYTVWMEESSLPVPMEKVASLHKILEHLHPHKTTDFFLFCKPKTQVLVRQTEWSKLDKMNAGAESDNILNQLLQIIESNPFYRLEQKLGRNPSHFSKYELKWMRNRVKLNHLQGQTNFMPARHCNRAEDPWQLTAVPQRSMCVIIKCSIVAAAPCHFHRGSDLLVQND